MLEAKSCGAETVPSPQTTLPVNTPPLVAVKVQSRLSQSSGPRGGRPSDGQLAPVSAPVAAKLAAVAAPTMPLVWHMRLCSAIIWDLNGMHQHSVLSCLDCFDRSRNWAATQTDLQIDLLFLQGIQKACEDQTGLWKHQTWR